MAHVPLGSRHLKTLGVVDDGLLRKCGSHLQESIMIYYANTPALFCMTLMNSRQRLQEGHAFGRWQDYEDNRSYCLLPAHSAEPNW